jgi:peptide/nickel transport system substrate-binding protein
MPGFPRSSKVSSTALAAGALALALTACNAGSSSTGTSGGEQAVEAPETLAVGLAAEPASLDFTTTDGAAIPEALLYNVLETLVKVDSETGEIVPLLAEDYEVSDDGTQYAFTLREDVTFSNGDEFTAEDVKFSIDRVKSDAWTVSLKSAMDVVENVEVTSPTEVVVTLSEPSNDWLYRMTTRIGAMFSETGVDDLANDPVGTGPYVVAARTRGDSLTLETRDDYWGELPDVEEVTLRYFGDATALNNALISGGIDVIGTLQSPESLERFESDDRFQVLEGTTNGELVLSMNNARPPFDDRRVRQAVKYALDRQAILDTTYAGMGELIGSMVPPTDPWYEDLTDLYPHDPEKARQLLAEAGATDVEVAFRIPNLPYAVTAAQVVKSQLAEVGISANIEVLEFPARWLEEVLRGQDYDMSLIAHVEPRDITTFADPEYYWGYDSPEFQALIDEAQTADEQRRVELLQQAARLLADDAAADWLFLLPSLIVAEKDVEGLPVNRVSESFDLTGVSRS